MGIQSIIVSFVLFRWWVEEWDLRGGRKEKSGLTFWKVDVSLVHSASACAWGVVVLVGEGASSQGDSSGSVFCWMGRRGDADVNSEGIPLLVGSESSLFVIRLSGPGLP